MQLLDKTDPAVLSDYYREEGDDSELTRRRWATGLSLVGALAGQLVSAYQTGLIRHLPDPPSGGLFDSDKVDASDYAYKRADTPDGLLMLRNYATTAMIVGGGGMDRARQRPWWSILAFGKAVFDIGLNMKLAREEYKDNKQLCAYCQTANLASLATAAVLAPEAWRAFKQLKRKA